MNLQKKKLIKQMMFFALPYLFFYFLQTLYGMADLFIVGQFDTVVSTTAASIGSQVMHMITVMIVGLAMGSTVIIARNKGAKKEENVSISIAMESLLKKQKELIQQKKHELDIMENKINVRLDQIKDAKTSLIDTIEIKYCSKKPIIYIKDNFKWNSYYSLEPLIRKLEYKQKFPITFQGKVGVGISIPFHETHLNAPIYYQKLYDYIKKNNYEINGYYLEIAIIDDSIENDSSKYITKISIPVKQK